MHMKALHGLIAGILIAALLTVGLAWLAMPQLMLEVTESQFDFDRTVSTLQAAAQAAGWKNLKVYDLRTAFNEAGYPERAQIKVLSLGQPHYSHEILQLDANKKVAAAMPHRIAVYETESGKVLVSGMNLGLMGEMFGGTIADVMGSRAQPDMEQILRSVAVR
jgi:uncharacterized protein (DUF302 family)